MKAGDKGNVAYAYGLNRIYSKLQHVQCFLKMVNGMAMQCFLRKEIHTPDRVNAKAIITQRAHFQVVLFFFFSVDPETVFAL